MLRTDARGYSTTDSGIEDGSRLSASRTRRFIRCLVTESLAVFLDTMTAYPAVFLEIVALKFAEDTLLPLFRADGKSERESRFRRGNTFYYAVKRLRPIRRRFCTIFRPDAVLLRERNPCVLALLRFFG